MEMEDDPRMDPMLISSALLLQELNIAKKEVEKWKTDSSENQEKYKKSDQEKTRLQKETAKLRQQVSQLRKRIKELENENAELKASILRIQPSESVLFCKAQGSANKLPRKECYSSNNSHACSSISNGSLGITKNNNEEMKSNESIGTIIEEFEAVMKQTPPQTKVMQANPLVNVRQFSEIKSKSEGNNGKSILSLSVVGLDSRNTLNLQTMSPNIDRIRVSDCIDEDIDEASPCSSKDFSSSKSRSRYAASEDFEEEGRKSGDSSGFLQPPSCFYHSEETDRLSSPRQEYLPACTFEMQSDISKCVGMHKYFRQSKDSKIPLPSIEEFHPGSLDTPLKHPEFEQRNSKSKSKRSSTCIEEITLENGLERAKSMITRESHKKLFEDFFVVGIEKHSFEPQKIKNYAFLKPSKLYSFHHYADYNDCERRKMIQEFCFPNGARVSALNPSSSTTEIENLIYRKANDSRNENTFVFTLNSLEEDSPEEQPRHIFCVCVKYTDLLHSTGTKVFTKIKS